MLLYHYEYMRSYGEKPDDPWVKLGHAIVLQAVDDYRKAKRGGLSIKQYEKFFNSDWFCVLTRGRIDGAVLMEHLDKKGSRKKKTNITG